MAPFSARSAPASVALLLAAAALPAAALRDTADSAQELLGSAQEEVLLPGPGRAGAIHAARRNGRNREGWFDPNGWKGDRCSNAICDAIAECVAAGFKDPDPRKLVYDPRGVDHVTKGGKKCTDLQRTQNLCIWSWSFSFLRKCGCHSRQFYATEEHGFGSPSPGLFYKDVSTLLHSPEDTHVRALDSDALDDSLLDQEEAISAMRDIVMKAGTRLGRPRQEVEKVAAVLQVRGIVTREALAQVDARSAREMQIPLRFVQTLQEELRGSEGAFLSEGRRTRDWGSLAGTGGVEGYIDDAGGGTGEAAKTGAAGSPMQGARSMQTIPRLSGLPESGKVQPTPRSSSCVALEATTGGSKVKAAASIERHLARHKVARDQKHKEVHGMRISNSKFEHWDDPWRDTSSFTRCKGAVIPMAGFKQPSSSSSPGPPSARAVMSPGRSRATASAAASLGRPQSPELGVKNTRLAGNVLSRCRPSLTPSSSAIIGSTASGSAASLGAQSGSLTARISPPRRRAGSAKGLAAQRGRLSDAAAAATAAASDDWAAAAAAAAASAAVAAVQPSVPLGGNFVAPGDVCGGGAGAGAGGGSSPGGSRGEEGMLDCDTSAITAITALASEALGLSSSDHILPSGHFSEGEVELEVEAATGAEVPEALEDSYSSPEAPRPTDGHGAEEGLSPGAASAAGAASAGGASAAETELACEAEFTEIAECGTEVLPPAHQTRSDAVPQVLSISPAHVSGGTAHGAGLLA